MPVVPARRFLAAAAFLALAAAAAAQAADGWIIATPLESVRAGASLGLEAVRPDAQTAWPETLRLRLRDGRGKVALLDLVAAPAADATADVAAVLGKKPQSLSPARDSLLKKGLIYSGERGRIAFTVPHFGRYLRTQA